MAENFSCGGVHSPTGSHSNIRPFDHSNISVRSAFTLIELMVASILLAMIATILTMVFNQSSIVWRTGVAGVVNLNDSRSALGTFHDIRDDLLPGLGGQDLKYRTVSLWDGANLRQSSQRAFNFNENIDWGKAKEFSLADAEKAGSQNVVGKGQEANDKINFSVGVRSLGPDGKPYTEDDITTWPNEID